MNPISSKPRFGSDRNIAFLALLVSALSLTITGMTLTIERDNVGDGHQLQDVAIINIWNGPPFSEACYNESNGCVDPQILRTSLGQPVMFMSHGAGLHHFYGGEKTYHYPEFTYGKPSDDDETFDCSNPEETCIWRGEEIHPEIKYADLDTGVLYPDHSYTFIPTRLGTIEYQCSFLPWMKGTIVVGP